MADKFGRKYELTIYPTIFIGTDPSTGERTFTEAFQEKIIRIENPFTLIFDIERHKGAKNSIATFQIYNLGETTRNQIYRDPYDHRGMKRLILKAGYSEPLTTIFDGNIQWCTSQRKSGQTNFITEIEAYGWAFALNNGHVNHTFQENATKQQIVDQLLKVLTSTGSEEQHLSRGYIRAFKDSQGNLETSYRRTLSGNAWDLLKLETDNACYVDNDQIHILSENECFIGAIPILNADVGILGVPKRSENHVAVEMLFEPAIECGQVIELESKYQSMFNGNYEIYSIRHFGQISDAVAGKCQTNVELFNLYKCFSNIDRSVSLV